MMEIVLRIHLVLRDKLKTVVEAVYRSLLWEMGLVTHHSIVYSGSTITAIARWPIVTWDLGETLDLTLIIDH